MAEMCGSLPILYIKARNNFDVGFQIGRTFKHFIREHTVTKTAKTLNQFHNTSEGRKLYNESLDVTKECYPHIVEEIKGMAKGAGVPFETLFLQAMISEILLCYINLEPSTDTKEEKEIAGCSDVLVNNGKCRVLAHNEDWVTDVDGMIFMVDVELDRCQLEKSDTCICKKGEDTTECLATRNERYLSFMFPGFLAGNTFYVNKVFAVTVNTLVPKEANQGAVPVDILLRAMIGCETIEECVGVMKNDSVGCSYGINVNIASRHTKDMWSLEVYPNNVRIIFNITFIVLKKLFLRLLNTIFDEVLTLNVLADYYLLSSKFPLTT